MSNKKAKRIGDIQTVANEDRKFGSALEYYHVRLEDESGEEHAYLFTEDQLQEAYARAQINPEDLLKVSKFRDIID